MHSCQLFKPHFRDSKPHLLTTPTQQEATPTHHTLLLKYSQEQCCIVLSQTAIASTFTMYVYKLVEWTLNFINRAYVHYYWLQELKEEKSSASVLVHTSLHTSSPSNTNSETQNLQFMSPESSPVQSPAFAYQCREEGLVKLITWAPHVCFLSCLQNCYCTKSERKPATLL